LYQVLDMFRNVMGVARAAAPLDKKTADLLADRRRRFVDECQSDNKCGAL
jgi:hypothetical protein